MLKINMLKITIIIIIIITLSSKFRICRLRGAVLFMKDVVLVVTHFLGVLADCVARVVVQSDDENLKRHLRADNVTFVENEPPSFSFGLPFVLTDCESVPIENPI